MELCGKMGKEVVREAFLNHLNTECNIACGIDKNADKCLDKNVYDDPYKIKEHPNVIIDFSVPKATLSILEYAKEKNLPIVIATTRFYR